MTAPQQSPQLRLMLVDEDPVFRLGLRIWLEQTAGHRVVAEADQAADALSLLQSRLALDNQTEWSDADENQAGPVVTQPELDLVILDLGLGSGDPDKIPGLQLCRDIKTRFPGLPVLLLSAQLAPVLQAAARQMGADGFAPRSLPVKQLGQLIEQLCRSNDKNPSIEDFVVDSFDNSNAIPTPSSLPGFLAPLRQTLRLSALSQIDIAMAAIETERRRGRSDLLTEAILAGRYRELKAARWLMNRLLATPGLSHSGPSGVASDAVERIREVRRYPEGSEQSRSFRLQRSRSHGGGRQDALSLGGDGPLAVTSAEHIALRQGNLASMVFERVFRKLQGNLANTSDVPIEIDILRDEKKRELFFLILRKIEDALDSLSRAGVPPGQLQEKTPLVLQDIWTAVMTDFFGRYYTLQVDNLEQPVVPTLLEEVDIVQASILGKIPQVPSLFGHLMFRESLVVDDGIYIASTPEAMNRSQTLLENLLIQLANAVIQPLLNQFGDVELLKKSLYQRRLMTSRDIARFRNDLSWRYRWDQFVNEPKAIFESQYRLFGFTERGIQTRFIYAPRREELDQLSGLQRTVTLAVEARDAISPRFRSLVALVGSGVVYVLTDVIGRGIGLIGRGILRGVGSAWNDPRYRGERKE